MLVLSRKIGQYIWIGKDVRVQVLGFRGRQVRLGIDAPANVEILRSELVQFVEEFEKPEFFEMEESCVAT